MYELIKITEHNYYIDCPTKVGIYEAAPGRVWLIDSGSDKDAGRKVWKHITEQGWTVEGILITHSNADHMGGAQLIMQRSSCKAYAAGMEKCVVEHTVLEPTLLYGGYPPAPLRGKFLMANSVPCEDIDRAPLPEGVQIIDLPGHFLEMFGVLTPEGVCYCADAVFSAAVTEKYHVNFVYDVRAAMDCLRELPKTNAKWFLPAHAELTEDIAPLCRLNLDKMEEIIAFLLETCRERVCFEDILKAVFDRFGLAMNFGQYVLVGSSVRSYLAYLLDDGQLKADFAENRMLWQSA